MIKKETLQFLSNLKENNSKEWMDANKKKYEAAKKNFIEFTQEVINGIGAVDESIALSELDSKKTILRINRDIRYSNDKTPYNSHFFTYINKGGRQNKCAGYFFRLTPGDSWYGGGVFKPDTETINKIRQEIDYHQSDWEAIINDKDIKNHQGEIMSSDSLSRPPKGIDKEHPLMDWIKKKDFYTKKYITDDELTNENLVGRIVQDLITTKKLVDFLNRAF